MVQMRSAVLLYWAGILLPAQISPAPFYAESSVVNAASPEAGLAPNTIATLYGSHLAWGIRQLTPADIAGGEIPTMLTGSGVRVLVGGVPAPLLYVSPGQVNFIVPANLRPGRHELQLALDSRYGRAVPLQIAETAPALFRADPEFAAAAGASGESLSPQRPARPGDVVVLYAAGLGETVPPADPRRIVRVEAPLRRSAEFRVEVDGTLLPAGHVQYAGLAPGFAGLYQINFRLPVSVGRNPAVRVGFDGAMSAGGVRIPVEPLPGDSF